MIWYSPLLPIFLGVILLVLSAFGTRPWLAILGIALVLPAYGLTTPLGANLLVLVIESRAPSATAFPGCDNTDSAVLLSGGLSRPAEHIEDFAAMTPETLARIFAWRNQQSLEVSPDLPLVISGGGPFRIPEAAVIAEFMRLLEPDGRVWQLETRSANTRESAQAVRTLLPASNCRILLATSALHLPRARLAFAEAGFDVCPLPLNRHYLQVGGWTSLWPHSSALRKSESGLHELVGEIYYRLTPVQAAHTCQLSP